MTMSQDKISEEFNNFMHKVTQISNIVHKLASNDKNIQEIGDLEAKQYLGEDPSNLECIDEEKIELRIKNDRTLVNKSAIVRDDGENSGTMSQKAFMDEISRDADMRYKDKLIRKEKMETFKTQATKAFKKGEYEKALCYYNKAIEQIKDSGILYKNRSLTYMNLKLFDKAISDLEWALKLDENDLKAWLLSAKAHYLNGNETGYNLAIQEAIQRNSADENFIQEYALYVKACDV